MRAWVIGLLGLLSACSQQAWIEKLSTPQERELAGRMALAVQSGDSAALWSKSVAGLQSSLNAATIAAMHRLAPPGPPRLESVVVQSETVNGTAFTAKTFLYELGAGQRWALLRITLIGGAGEPALGGAYIQPFDHSPVAANDLTFEGKGPIHYLWIAGMLFAVGTSLVAFVLILRTRGLRHKWLWAIGSLLSFVTFLLNWTTGEWLVQPISFLMLGAGAFRGGPFAPWTFNFAIPVVAIVFLTLRRMKRLPIRQTDSDQLETGTP